MRKKDQFGARPPDDRVYSSRPSLPRTAMFRFSGRVGDEIGDLLLQRWQGAWQLHRKGRWVWRAS
jgi:hypothetical protein